jgi:hypothetical protein
MQSKRREPLPRERYLMRLLRCQSLYQLEKLMNEALPPSNEENEQFEVIPGGFREDVERLAQRDDLLMELDQHWVTPKYADFRLPPKKGA